MYKQIVSIEKERLGTIDCALCEFEIKTSSLRGYKITLDDGTIFYTDLTCGKNLEFLFKGKP